MRRSGFEGLEETTTANMCHVLSRAFSSPLAMNSEDTGRLRLVIRDLPDRLQEPGRSLAAAWEHALENRQELALAYARLFLGPFEILAPPYASFYLQPDQQLMGPVSRFVAGVYADAGLSPGPGPREAPDHVSLEWECLYFLAYQYVATGEDLWLTKRDDFLANHVMHWMPLHADAVNRAHVHQYYDALSLFVSRLLQAPASIRHGATPATV